jgi:hypothetical protein
LKVNNAFNEMKQFNDSCENIVYVAMHKTTPFVITQQINLISSNVIELRGYARELSNSSIVTLYGEVRYDETLNHIKSLCICDFTIPKIYRNSGYGSIVLTQFIKYAQKLKVEFITGKLEFVDIGNAKSRTDEQSENRKQLHHFYSKHGFLITENESIILHLKQRC